MQNHFELFNLPQQFAVDAGALDSAYRDVQSRVHPDKFVNATDAEKRVAMQWATRANEAYQTLKIRRSARNTCASWLASICRPSRILRCRWPS